MEKGERRRHDWPIPLLPTPFSARYSKRWHFLCRELKHVEELLELGRNEHHRRFRRTAMLRPRRADGPRTGSGNIPGDAANPEAGRGGDFSENRRRPARWPVGPQLRRRDVLLAAADSLRGRHDAERGQPVDRRLAARAWRRPRDGRLRCRSPAARSSWPRPRHGPSWRWSCISTFRCSTRSIASSTRRSAAGGSASLPRRCC